MKRESPPQISENPLYALFQRQIKNRFLHFLKTFEVPTEKPCVFLDIGYGGEFFITHLAEETLLSSYILCHYFEEVEGMARKHNKNAIPALHRVVLDKNHLPFPAVFDVILVNWTTFFPPQPDFLLRQLIGCLKPGGRLYLVGLGECSFYEWFYACQKAEAPFSFSPFLTQRQPIWPESHRGELQEEWYEIPCLHLHALLELFENLQKTLFDYAPPFLLSLQRAFNLFCLETKGRLTFHTFYGRYVKPEELLEE